MLGPTRVNGAFYSFLAECEALTGEKWRQFAPGNQAPAVRLLALSYHGG
jgi:hypothetical protein